MTENKPTEATASTNPFEDSLRRRQREHIAMANEAAATATRVPQPKLPALVFLAVIPDRSDMYIQARGSVKGSNGELQLMKEARPGDLIIHVPAEEEVAAKLCRCASCGYERCDSEDDYCHGCRRLICLTCSTVFGHCGEGNHGLGDPAVEVAKLRSDLANSQERERVLGELAESFSVCVVADSFYKDVYFNFVKPDSATMKVAGGISSSLWADLERRRIATLSPDVPSLTIEVERLKLANEQQVYRGNSVSHWWAKAAAYGDIVHGCNPALAEAGHPVLDTGDNRTANTIASAVKALVFERDGISKKVFELEEKLGSIEGEYAKIKVDRDNAAKEVERLKGDLAEAQGVAMADELEISDKRKAIEVLTEGRGLDDDSLWASLKDQRDQARKDALAFEKERDSALARVRELEEVVRLVIDLFNQPWLDINGTGKKKVVCRRCKGSKICPATGGDCPDCNITGDPKKEVE